MATLLIKTTKDISNIMPYIVRFEKSGFPDNDGVQKVALSTVADIIDEQFTTVSIQTI